MASPHPGEAAPPTTRTMRTFTKAFKINVLIGKVNGFHLPFGPYTVPQVVSAGVLYLAAMVCRPWWGQYGAFDYLVPLVVALPAGWGLGQLDFGARSPLAWVLGLAAATTAPAFGCVNGRPTRWSRARPGAGRAVRVCVVPDPAPPVSGVPIGSERAAAAPAAGVEVPLPPPPPRAPAPATAVSARPVTALDRLLAAAAKVS